MVGVLGQAVCAALFLRILWSVLRSKLTRSGLENIPGPKTQSWWKGNFRQMFNPAAWEYHEHLASQYGAAIAVNAPMGVKHLYTFDPKAMHAILVKDSSNFDESVEVMQGRRLVFGDGLLGTEGMHHRKQRKMLNPVFSTAHMREMVPIFYEITHKLQDTLANRLKDGVPVQEIDMLSWMARISLELVGQSGLGYSFDTMSDEATAHPYSRTLKELIPTMSRLTFARSIIPPWMMQIGSPNFRRFVVDILPWKDLHRLRDMVDYMHDLSKEIYAGKKRAFEQGDEVVAQQVGRGKDILSILMRENMKAYEADRLDEGEVIDQISTLTFAAMDTTSSALSRTLHLLSTHQDVQDKLRQELIDARRVGGGHDLAYDELLALPYLDAICRETLRLYAPVPNILQSARQDAVIPLHTPITGLDGALLREIHVSRGTHIIISAHMSNRNPALWGPEALEWKPERWFSSLPEAVVDAHTPGIYSHLMTFSAGGRSCIGFKFSQLEMKVVLSILVETFRFSPSSKDSEVFWQMNGVVTPIVKGSTQPRLPLNVCLVN